MKAHIVENNVIVNTIEVDSLDFMENLIEATGGTIGWSYTDGVFSPPAPVFTEEQIRTERDAKLTESDWTQVLDAPVDQAAWATYRQELRDVPAQTGFPNNINWPTEP